MLGLFLYIHDAKSYKCGLLAMLEAKIKLNIMGMQWNTECLSVPYIFWLDSKCKNKDQADI